MMRSNHMIVGSGILGLGLALFSGVAAAQDAGNQRLVRDQRTVKSRIEKIFAKMERLAEKLEAEGKTYNAGLLKRALEQLRQEAVPDRIDEVLPDLSSSRFSTIERQQELLASLEVTYSILLDRNDLEKLEQKLERLQAGLKQIRQLRSEQRELVDATRSLVETREALLERARDEVRNLIQQQEALAERTEDRANSGDGQVRDLQETLDALATAQAMEVSRSEDALASQVGRTRQLIDEMISAEMSALEGLSENARNPVPPNESADVGDPQSGEPGEAVVEAESSMTEHERDAFLRHQEESESILERLGRELERMKGGEDAISSPIAPEIVDELSPLMSAVLSAVGEAEAAARKMDSREAARSSAEALKSLRMARERLDEALRAEKGAIPDGTPEREDSIAMQASEAAGSAREQQASENTAEAAERASESAEQAADAARSGDPGQMLDAQRESLAALNEARTALLPESQPARQRADNLSSQQDYVSRATGRLEDTLEKLSALSEEIEEDAKRLGLADEAGEQMSEAAEDLSEGSLESAMNSQRSAMSSLTKLESSLSSAAEGQQSLTAADEEQKDEDYRDLAERQQELEDRTRDLMKRLEEAQEGQRNQSLSSASNRMEDAGSSLSENEGEEAIPPEEEAERYLAQAQQEMEEEEERYQNLRQEELLFKVREELLALRDEATEIRDRTVEIDRRRQESGRLRRTDRSKVKTIATDCRKLRVRNDGVIEKVDEDGAIVFSFNLSKNSEDLERLSGMMGTKQLSTDEYTRSIQQDVVERYDRLLATLKNEMERRRDAESSEGESPPSEGAPPLVPKVAELLMVKKMEEAALRKLDIFMKTHPELGDGELDEVARERLIRMGHQHSEVTRLFDSLVEEAMQANGEEQQ